MQPTGIFSVIVASVNRLGLHQVAPEKSPPYFMLGTLDYDYHLSLLDEAQANPNRDPFKTVMMDHDEAGLITSPRFATADEAYTWGTTNFPHLMKVGQIQAANGKVWTYELMSPKAINKAWLNFAHTGLAYPDAPRPAWVDPLKAANADPSSGDFIENVGFN